MQSCEKHESSDVRQQASQVIAFVYQHVSLAAEASRTPSAPSVGVLGASVDEDALEQAAYQPQLMRPLCSLLLAFAKEKHTPVRTNAELALVEILLVRWPSHSKQVQVLRKVLFLSFLSFLSFPPLFLFTKHF